MHTVYVIYCFNDSESFIKIGKTSRSVSSRFNSKLKLPYNYFIIDSFTFITSSECSIKEKKLHNKYKKFKYNPINKFQGYTECFSLNLLDKIKNRV